MSKIFRMFVLAASTVLLLAGCEIITEDEYYVDPPVVYVPTPSNYHGKQHLPSNHHGKQSQPQVHGKNNHYEKQVIVKQSGVNHHGRQGVARENTVNHHGRVNNGPGHVVMTSPVIKRVVKEKTTVTVPVIAYRNTQHKPVISHQPVKVKPAPKRSHGKVKQKAHKTAISSDAKLHLFAANF